MLELSTSRARASLGAGTCTPRALSHTCQPLSIRCPSIIGPSGAVLGAMDSLGNSPDHKTLNHFGFQQFRARLIYSLQRREEPKHRVQLAVAPVDILDTNHSVCSNLMPRLPLRDVRRPHRPSARRGPVTDDNGYCWTAGSADSPGVVVTLDHKWSRNERKR